MPPLEHSGRTLGRMLSADHRANEERPRPMYERALPRVPADVKNVYTVNPLARQSVAGGLTSGLASGLASCGSRGVDQEKQVQTEERRMSGKGIYCEGVAGMAQLDAEALQQMCADWDSLPSQLRVGGSLDGHLPSERVERKQHQITNMMFFVAIQLLALGAQPQRGKGERFTRARALPTR